MNPEKSIVLIHGWGLSSDIFKPLYHYLKNDFLVYLLDLPGFGASSIGKPLFLEDYARHLYDFLEKNNIKNPVLLGHSFGGAVATKFALLYPGKASKLILVSASSIRQIRSKTNLFKKITGFLSPLFPKKARNIILKILKLDRSDYAQIKNPDLRETFRNVIGEDLGGQISKIEIPALVIWGENDTITPLSEGKLIAGSLPRGKLAIIKNAGHFSFMEKQEEFIKLVEEFSK